MSVSVSVLEQAVELERARVALLATAALVPAEVHARQRQQQEEDEAQMKQQELLQLRKSADGGGAESGERSGRREENETTAGDRCRRTGTRMAWGSVTN